ncbi:MAG TPA: ABC transporter permease subunit [Tepidisphaeraceae bacterium]|jgi:sulfate transport system permease protein
MASPRPATRTSFAGLSLRAFVIVYLLVFVGLPLAAAVPPLVREPPATVWAKATAPEAVAAVKLSVYAAAVGGGINTVMGGLIAWALVRSRFPGRRLADTLVDLPFAIPAVVAGIALMSLYGPASAAGQWMGEDGWLGRRLMSVGMPALSVTGSFFGLVLANLFVTLPFVVRTVQPVIAGLESDVEEAAASLGAGAAGVFFRVTFPQILPAMLMGFALAFSRGVNEYGIAALISGKIPFESLVASVYILQRLDVRDFTGATAVSVVLTLISLSVLVATYGWSQWRLRRGA